MLCKLRKKHNKIAAKVQKTFELCKFSADFFCERKIFLRFARKPYKCQENGDQNLDFSVFCCTFAPDFDDRS